MLGSVVLGAVCVVVSEIPLFANMYECIAACALHCACCYDGCPLFAESVVVGVVPALLSAASLCLVLFGVCGAVSLAGGY